MNKMKKIITLPIIFALLLTCMPLTAYAEIGQDGMSFTIDSQNMTATLYKFSGVQTDVVIPSYVNSFEVVGISQYAFENKTITSVSIPSTVKTIGKYAFSGCASLSELVIPESVTKVEEYAFEKCTSLESVSFNANVDTIPFSAFQSCTSLQSITVSNAVNTIENYAFKNCSALETFPFDNISTIKPNAFNNCGLTEVTFSDVLTSIPSQAFYKCQSLGYVTIPNSVTSISYNSFKNSPLVCIKCYHDSFALSYAKQYNIPYLLLDSVILGDVDGNGTVDIRDVTEIQKHLAELGEPLGELNLYAADVNGDGDVDISDATAIQMFLAELDFSYPIGEITSKSN